MWIPDCWRMEHLICVELVIHNKKIIKITWYFIQKRLNLFMLKLHDPDINSQVK